jgi:hypothetical protein
MKAFMQMPECRESLSKLLREASQLTDELFELQEVGHPLQMESCKCALTANYRIRIYRVLMRC